MARLKEHYIKEVAPALLKKYEYKSCMVCSFEEKYQRPHAVKLPMGNCNHSDFNVPY